MPAVRVSHPIKGRVPSAIGKPVDQLKEDEKTIYFERCAFVIEVPSIRDIVNGNDLSLTIGGARAYNLDNLNGRKSEEKFKVFIGFKNKICCNLAIFTDGFKAELKARSVNEIVQEVYSLCASFRPEVQIQSMTGLHDSFLTEHQLATLVGRSRLYQYLTPKEKKEIAQNLPLSDSQISLVAKDYYVDKAFCRSSDGSLNLWSLLNLFTSATKSSYIDSFLDRTEGSSSFIVELQNSLRTGEFNWFLS